MSASGESISIDIDKIITPEYAYTLDHFLYKYTGQDRAQAECADFFSEENYSIRNTLFDTTGEEEVYNRYLLTGVCTRIGRNNDRALIFYVLSPKNINDSLAIVGGEGITYYLLDKGSGRVLLAWGETPEDSAEEDEGGGSGLPGGPLPRFGFKPGTGSGSVPDIQLYPQPFI